MIVIAFGCCCAFWIHLLFIDGEVQILPDTLIYFYKGERGQQGDRGQPGEDGFKGTKVR